MAQILAFAREWSNWYRVLRHTSDSSIPYATAIGWRSAEWCS
jgi:hypothetical protein